MHTADLRMPDAQITRYLDPPDNTSYPLEYAFRSLGDVEGKRVLDVGCGSGESTVLLGKRGARVIALDLSEPLIDLARRRAGLHGVVDQAAFCVASAHRLPLADESIDVVFGCAILHHLDVQLVRGEVWRVLKPGSRAIFQEPVRESATLRFMRRWFPRRDPDVSPFEQPLNRTDLKTLGSGFSACSVRSFVLPHVTLAERLGLSESLITRCYRADRQILNRVPMLQRFSSIRVIELTR